MTARQVAEALDKNYHTTRCLLRKMVASGEICQVNNHYLAIAAGNIRNQRNQRHQSDLSAQQHMSQIDYREDPYPPAHDCCNDAHSKVSIKGSQTQSIPFPFGGCSLPFTTACISHDYKKGNYHVIQLAGIVVCRKYFSEFGQSFFAWHSHGRCKTGML
jgi:hypothetical protein